MTSEAVTSEAAASEATQITHSASEAVKIPLELCNMIGLKVGT